MGEASNGCVASIVCASCLLQVANHLGLDKSLIESAPSASVPR